MKRINYFLIAFAFLLINTGSYALEMGVGVKGGLGINSVRLGSDNERGGIIAPVGGLFFDLSSGSEIIRVGFELDILYQQRGAEFSDGDKSITYLGFPAIIKLEFEPIYYIGFGLNYQQKLSSQVTNVKSDNLEIILDLGFDAEMTNNIDFVFDLRFNYGVVNYSSITGDSAKTEAVEILVGLLL